MYATNAEIVHASGGIRSIDESVLKLLRKRNKKKRYGLREWLEIVEEELGPRGYEGYKAMAGGKVVIPSKDFLGPGFELVREDQYPYELGFSQFSVTKGKIVGLVPASRAAEAGAKEGDELVRFGNFWNAADHYGKNQTLVLQRDGKQFEVSYFPRGWKKVESWQVVEKGKGSGHRELR
jgi:predicted metalloprotease with PDZ domain